MIKLELNQSVKIKDCNGITRDGVVKGLSLDNKDEVQVSVEYLTPTRSLFTLENIISE